MSIEAEKEAPQLELFSIDEFGLYNQNEYKNFTPHQTFVYKLGQELALSYIIDTPESKDEFTSEFRNSLKRKTAAFNFKLKKCNLCEFKTESSYILDKHLTEPHLSSTFSCNFCLSFRSKGKEKYVEHLLQEHNRVCKLEKPFIHTSIMCPICDYETTTNTVVPKLVEIEKTLHHIEQCCPFREEKLNSNETINCLNILNNQLTPSQHDLLDYEFLFNQKPQDDYMNKYNLFTSHLIKTNTSLAFQTIQEESFNHHLVKLYQSLLLYNQEKTTVKSDKTEKDVPIKIETPIQMEIPKIQNLNKANETKKNLIVSNLSNDISKPSELRPLNSNTIQNISNNHIYQQQEQQKNLKIIRISSNTTNHSISSSVNLPYMKKTDMLQNNLNNNNYSNSNNQSIKVIRLNQNLVLVKKPSLINPPIIISPSQNSNQTLQSSRLLAPKPDLKLNNTDKRVIDLTLDDEDEDENNKKNESNSNDFKKIKRSNQNLNTTENYVQMKLKEIDQEKKTIFTSLDLLNSIKDTDLVELMGLNGKCYLCDNSTEFDNILNHLKQIHYFDAINSNNQLRCLLCGIQFVTRTDLIKHSYQAHNIIVFSSLNKVFTLSSKTIKNEKFETDNKTNDTVLIDSKPELINIKIEKNETKIARVFKKCLKCYKIFDSFGSLLYHIKDEHTSLFNPKSKVFDFNKELVEQIEIKNEKKEGKKDEKNDSKIIVNDINNENESSEISLIKCEFCKFKNLKSNSDYEQHLIDAHLKKCQVKIEKVNENLIDENKKLVQDTTLRRSSRNRKIRN